MRILRILIAAALLGGLAMALYVLLQPRPAAPPTAVIDPQAYREPATPDAATPPTASPAKPSGEGAIAARLCTSHGRDSGDAATLFGHLRQPQTSQGALAATPPGFGGGNCGLIGRDAVGPLAALYAAARAESPAVAAQIYGLSCFRSIARQADLYCKPDRIAARGYAGQARWVAPPGFSEHATGASLDFGNRDGACNLDPCFADTPVGHWLALNAGRFGFRMSFPAGNAQGVSYEPWHFRYVGGRGEGGQPPPTPRVLVPPVPVPPPPTDDTVITPPTDPH